MIWCDVFKAGRGGVEITVIELQPTPLRRSFFELKEPDDASEVSGFGEDIVIAEMYVLKYEARICIVLWLPDFKTRTYSPEEPL